MPRGLSRRVDRSGELRSRRLAYALLALLGMWPALGCKTKPYVNAHIESVNAEYRQLEDYVYVLEEQNARLQQELDAARKSPATDALPGSGASPSRRGLFRRAPSRGASPSNDNATPEMQPPVIEVPDAAPSSPSSPSLPRSTFRQADQPEVELSPPAETPPSIEVPRPGSGGALPSPEGLLPAPSTLPQDTSPPERLPSKPTDRKITHVFVNPALTGGCDLDGQPGDDGLKIVLEPRNETDEYVPEAGSLSLVVLDPDREGDAARVARWDFDQEAARQVLAESGAGRGLKLEMPWPAAAPSANRLKLYVRYETPDGRKLQADREIFVTPPGQAISRWTPRASEERRAAHEEATEPVRPLR